MRVPPIKYLMVDGEGNPNQAAPFRDGIGALYGCAYTLKFALRASRAIDFRVMPLSARYHADDPSAFADGPVAGWRWTIMIPVPSAVTASDLKRAKAELRRKRGESAAVEAVRLEMLREGRCAQLLHVGPWSDERANIEKLHAFVRERGLGLAGSHHEIYLSDPNRTKPEKLKTIVRQPVAARRPHRG